MAGRALLAGVQPHQRETGSRVIERGAQPVHGRVTPGAVLREVRHFMWRVIGAVVISQMAVDAGAGGQAEVVVDVTLRALQAGVGAGERETGSRVIELGAHPLN